MNILDVKMMTGFEGDKLDLIFQVQRALEEKYDSIERSKGCYVPKDPIDINDCKSQIYLKDLFYRVITELVEASETLKNKPWKLSEVICDRDHLYEELGDALHFLIMLCSKIGITSEKLFEIYFKKSEVNRWRQNTKY